VDPGASATAGSHAVGAHFPRLARVLALVARRVWRLCRLESVLMRVELLRLDFRDG